MSLTQTKINNLHLVLRTRFPQITFSLLSLSFLIKSLRNQEVKDFQYLGSDEFTRVK